MRGRKPVARVARRDRGSVTLWVVFVAFLTMVLLTLVVDGGQAMIVKSRAADMAEQAARAAADDISPGALRAGQVALAPGACDLTAGPAAQLVASYAKGSGVNVQMLTCAPGHDAQGNLDVTVKVQLTLNLVIPAGAFSRLKPVATETAYLACGTAVQQTAC